MNLLKTLDNTLAKCEGLAIGILLIAMSVIAFIQVITRYCFFYSLIWSEEASRYCMIWMTFIGASWAVAKQEHINIDILSSTLWNRLKFNIRGFINLLIFVFLVCCIFYTYLLVTSTCEAEQMTPAIGFPMFSVYTVVFIALIFAAFHALVRVINCFRNKGAD